MLIEVGRPTFWRGLSSSSSLHLCVPPFLCANCAHSALISFSFPTWPLSTRITISTVAIEASYKDWPRLLVSIITGLRLSNCLFSDAVIIETVWRRMVGWLINVEQLVGWELAEETEVFGENLLQCNFVRHKSHPGWRLTTWAVTLPSVLFLLLLVIYYGWKRIKLLSQQQVFLPSTWICPTISALSLWETQKMKVESILPTVPICKSEYRARTASSIHPRSASLGPSTA
jgi:hypothetical protein